MNYSIRRAPTSITIAFVGIILSRILQSHVIGYTIIISLSIFIIYRQYNCIRISPCVAVALCLSVIATSSTLLNSKLAVEDGLKPLIWFILLFAFYTIGRSGREQYFEKSLLQIRTVVIASILFGFLFQYVLHLKFASDSSIGDTNIYAPFEVVSLTDPFQLRMRSVYSHPIIFSNILIFVWFINYNLEKNKVKKYAYAVMILVALLLTGTRSAWITFAVLLGILALIRLQRLKNLWNYFALLPIPLMLVVLLLWRFGILDAIGDRFRSLLTDVSFSQRSGAIVYMINLVISNPLSLLFGNGFPASKQAMSQTTIQIDSFDTVDNQWVACLYDLGVIYTLLILALCIKIIIKTYKTNNTVLSSILFGGVLLGMFSMCFYDMFTWDIMVYIWFSSLGYLLGCIEGKGSSTPLVCECNY